MGERSGLKPWASEDAALKIRFICFILFFYFFNMYIKLRGFINIDIKTHVFYRILRPSLLIYAMNKLLNTLYTCTRYPYTRK